MIFPKISIITPSFNQGEYLERTIQSVLNQNYPNLEYIIMDGGSTDHSVEIIKKYEDRITFWKSEPDRGMYDALQKGFAKSTGDIMTWINSDDTLAIKSLFTAAQIFSDYPQVEWLNGLPNQMDEEGRLTGVAALPRWNKYNYLKKDFKYIQQEGIFWRRSLWEKAGGFIDVNFHLAADLELWSRFFIHAQLYYVNTLLGTFRARSKNQKSLEQLDDYHDDALMVLQQMHSSLEEQKNIKLTQTSFWRMVSKRPLQFIYKMLKYDKVAAAVYEYPPSFYFNRAANKFMLPEELNSYRNNT